MRSEKPSARGKVSGDARADIDAHLTRGALEGICLGLQIGEGLADLVIIGLRKGLALVENFTAALIVEGKRNIESDGAPERALGGRRFNRSVLLGPGIDLKRVTVGGGGPDRPHGRDEIIADKLGKPR